MITETKQAASTAELPQDMFVRPQEPDYLSVQRLFVGIKSFKEPKFVIMELKLVVQLAQQLKLDMTVLQMVLEVSAPYDLSVEI